jgi:uncharacterized damage-inducible protein DinB
VLDKAGVKRMFDYTVWANHRTLRAAATLGVDDFKRELGSSHGGVRGTLAHMMGAEWIWLERWKGLSPKALFDEGEFPNVVALRDRWKVIEDHRKSWLTSLPEADLARTVSYRSLDRKPHTAVLWQLIQHVVNHSTYHRGQVVTLMRQLGAKPGSTDLVIWDRERAERH